MLVVETAALRHQNRMIETTGAPEEVALERISGVENKIGRILDQMERVLDLMFKQSNGAHENRIAFDVLLTMLAEAGVLDLNTFAERCREIAAHKDGKKETTANAKIEEVKIETEKLGDEMLRARFVNAYRGDDLQTFEKLIDGALDAINSRKEIPATKALERAAAFAPDNAPLNYFLGVYFFQTNRMMLARDYIARAYRWNETDSRWRIELLLGIACGDEGDVDEARKLLHESESVAPNFAVYFALGRISALEDEWKSAFKYFRAALNKCECAEGHYAVGTAALHLKRSRLALRHLQNAVEIDAAYAPAFYLLGFAQLTLKQRARAVEAWRKACDLGTVENSTAHYRATLSVAMTTAVPKIPTARVAFGMKENSTRNQRRKSAGLLTSGDERLARFLIEKALETTAVRLTPALMPL
ncbi:MAG: hypothetical protein NVSMB56_04810 [Pyrinomonadaceae bacterium]